MSNKSTFLRKNVGTGVPSNQPESDASKNIEQYLDGLKKLVEEGVEEQEMFNTILEDITSGNMTAVAASIAVLNSVIDSARGAAGLALKRLEVIEDERLGMIDSGVKIIMSSLVNRGLLSDKDYNFSASQLSHLNKMITTCEELNSDDITEKRVDEIIKDLSDKAYKMAVIEFGDIYGESRN